MNYTPLNIGKMDKRIIFLKRSGGFDSMGQEIEGEWQPYKTVWATVKALRGGEYWETQKVRPEKTYKVITRYHPGITPDMKIQYKNKILEIENVNDVNEANYMLEIQCIEYVEKE